MSRYHPFYCELEARLRQADKVAQARRWRMVQEANAGRLRHVQQASRAINALVNRRHTLFDTLRTSALAGESDYAGLER